ncbi:MAG: ComEC family competence protein, partial [Muribaculaceae bacterium]|nr:ComEC family competence protein [Muribaculaceae bacterium]
MKAPLSYVPALPAAIGIIAGILSERIGIGAATAKAAGVMFVVLYVMRRHYSALCALAVATGALMAMSRSTPSPPAGLWGETHSFTAEVREIKENATTTTFVTEIRSIDAHECQPIPILVIVNSVTAPPQAGSVIEFTGALYPIEQKEEVPFERDFAGFYLRQGITGRCYLNTSPEEVSPPSGMKAFTNEVRLRIFNSIVDSPVNGSTASFLVASIIGDRNYLTADEYSSYRDTGVAHILALSGLHVGIIASMLAFILMPLRLGRGGRYMSGIITAVATWSYAMVGGLTPSILRATVMITVFIIARLIGRGSNGFNSLSISVVVILCASPTSLFTPGFQLSVAAVATILMFGNVLPSGLRRYPVLYFITGIMV